MLKILFYLLFVLVIIKIFIKVLNKTNKSLYFISFIVLPIIVTSPELLGIIKNLRNNQPYFIVNNIIGSNIINLLIIAIYNIVTIKRTKSKSFSNVYLYVSSLLIYIYVVIINSFLSNNLLIFNLDFSSIIIIFSFLLYLVFISINNIKIKDIKIKESHLLSLLPLVLIMFIKNSLLNTMNFNFFILPLISSIPELILFIKLHKIDYRMSYGLIIGSIMFNNLYLSLSDLFYPKYSIYFFSTNHTIISTKITLFLLISLFGFLIYQKKYPLMLTILFSLIIIISYLYILQPIF